MNANLRGGQAAAAGGSGFDVYSSRSPSSSFAAAGRLRDLAGSSSSLTVLLDQSRSFQITMSSLLGLIAAIQMTLLMMLVVYRSKRVLEFAQPTFICLFVFVGMRNDFDRGLLSVHIHKRSGMFDTGPYHIFDPDCHGRNNYRARVEDVGATVKSTGFGWIKRKFVSHGTSETDGIAWAVITRGLL